MRRKTTFANIHVKNMTHVTELELNTRAFAPPFVHIPFIPVGRTKECQECAKIFLQVGSSAVRFKNVPLTTESKISLRSRSCSPAIIIIIIIIITVIITITIRIIMCLATLIFKSILTLRQIQKTNERFMWNWCRAGYWQQNEPEPVFYLTIDSTRSVSSGC